MSTPHMIRASEPGALIDAIPYLLGFTASESLVLIGLTPATPDGPERHLIRLTIRLDLSPDTLNRAGFAEATTVLRRSGCSDLIAVALTADPLAHLDRLADVIGELAAAVGPAGVDLVDVLLASDTRWWSLRCTDPDCCPITGHPRGGTPVLAAAATYAGVPRPAASRQDLLAALDPEPGRQEHRAALARAEDRVSDALRHRRIASIRQQDRGLITATLRRRTRGRAPLNTAPPGTAPPVDLPLEVDVLARIGVALQHRPVRDELWLAVDDGHRSAELLALELCRRLPIPYDAPALFLYGWAMWRAGQTVLADAAAQRCQQSDPTYSALPLLHAAVDHRLDPASTPPLRLGLS